VYYLYDLAGHVITELNSSGGWNRGEVYAGGGHVATYADGKTYFSHGDWLGTERARTDVSGAVAETCQGLPFGDELNCSGGDASPLHFTGKERDPESGLDNFGARYDASSLGRFMSPDPLLNSGHPWNPQSWNRYAYALNNPLAIVDPMGLYNLVNKCAQDDKKCNKQFQRHAKDLKLGLANLQKRVDKMKAGAENREVSRDGKGTRVAVARCGNGTDGHSRGFLFDRLSQRPS
jgi:RHS repeat-associated protein